MIFHEEIRDLFTCDNSYYLAHCISADFALTKGIAVEFDKRFDMRRKLRKQYPSYLKSDWAARHGRGDALIIDKVINLITKERYWEKPTLDNVGNALATLKEHAHEKQIDKVAMPLIGCGLDRLKWKDVKQKIFDVFQDTNMEILVCKVK